LELLSTARASSQAQVVADELSSSIGRFTIVSPRAEVASALYSITPFVGLPAAHFLLLFISLESLFAPKLRSDDAQAHVQSLLDSTQQARISPEDRVAICSSLSFLKAQSIAQTGRDLAASLLGGRTYQELQAPEFFSKVYGLRNDMVHRGTIDRAGGPLARPCRSGADAEG
jgi:hypothetical protein